MRESPKRHPLAVLRLMLGMGQKEMASLLNCSRPTIQAIELGKLKLSERLAEDICFKTGVSLEWLLAGDPEKPPTGESLGGLYDKQLFEIVQAELERPREAGLDAELIYIFLAEYLARIASVTLTAMKKNEFPLFRYKARMALEELAQRFGKGPLFGNTERLVLYDVLRHQVPNFQPIVALFHDELCKLMSTKRVRYESEQTSFVLGSPRKKKTVSKSPRK